MRFRNSKPMRSRMYWACSGVLGCGYYFSLPQAVSVSIYYSTSSLSMIKYCYQTVCVTAPTPREIESIREILICVFRRTELKNHVVHHISLIRLLHSFPKLIGFGYTFSVICKKFRNASHMVITGRSFIEHYGNAHVPIGM